MNSGGVVLYNINNIVDIISKYQKNFKEKVFREVNSDTDILMDLFDITTKQKQENMQYWNRELGAIWELITKELFKTYQGFREAQFGEFGNDSPVDYFIDKMAIDAKYRIGSGDSGTLKKFKQYGEMLCSKGYTPIFLILRSDNLDSAIAAARSGGWTILTYKESFNFILKYSEVDIVKELARIKIEYLK